MVPRLNTPQGPSRRPSRPALSLAPLPTTSSVSVDSQLTDNSKFDPGYISSSAASSVSLSLRTQDPTSATSGASPDTDGSLSMRELEQHLDTIKASLDGRDPDVKDLDDEGWKIIARAGRIEELGSLGEGAGGAVTKCKLRGGNTTFALKVMVSLSFYHIN
jgi:mitogen-activated protein kinase kinase